LLDFDFKAAEEESDIMGRLLSMYSGKQHGCPYSRHSRGKRCRKNYFKR
jgi:hypothetical protein